MEIKLDSVSPIIPEQRALFSLRGKVSEVLKGSKIEITETTAKGDYIKVSAVITHEDKTTSICDGYANAVGLALSQRLNAEMVAICGCLRELDVNVTFGESQGVVEESINPMIRFSASDVLACRDVQAVFDLLKKFGIDEKPLVKYQREIRKEGGRFNPKKAANFLFPDQNKAVYVNPLPKKKPKVGILKEEVLEPKRELPPIVRSGKDANNVHILIGEKNLTISTINTIADTNFKSIFEFVQRGTAEQVELIKNWNS